jgi:hypothetical protein
LTSLVYCAACVLSHWVRSVASGQCGLVVPNTGCDHSPAVVPVRGRTRHMKRSPGLKPASANVGDWGVSVRFGRHTPTIAAGPVATLSEPTGVRSIW